MSIDSATGEGFSTPTGDDAQAPHCPLCDYDLRAQVEPRCPECGYQFDWNELRDPARRLHPYLFEHHPERNLWSLRRTFLGGMRPRRFWAELYPTQRSRVLRLLIYWLIFAVACAAPSILLLSRSVAAADASNRITRVRWNATMPPQQRLMITRMYGSVQTYFDQALPVWPSWGVIHHALRRYYLPPTILPVLLALSWPVLTFAALMIFQISMRRAKVRPVHVLRCVIYSADSAAIIVLIAIAVIILPWLLPFRSPVLPYLNQRLWAMYLSIGLIAWLSYRLWIAYRKYLRFDHALATVVVSQIMVALLVYKFVLDWRLLR